MTEEPETPGWYRQLAAELRGGCAFGEARCTDPLMLDLFGVSAAEPLPVVVVASDDPRAVAYWRSKGLDLFSLGLVAGSPQVYTPSIPSFTRAGAYRDTVSLTLAPGRPSAAALWTPAHYARWCSKPSPFPLPKRLPVAGLQTVPWPLYGAPKRPSAPQRPA